MAGTRTEAFDVKDVGLRRTEPLTVINSAIRKGEKRTDTTIGGVSL